MGAKMPFLDLPLRVQNLKKQTPFWGEHPRAPTPQFGHAWPVSQAWSLASLAPVTQPEPANEKQQQQLLDPSLIQYIISCKTSAC